MVNKFKMKTKSIQRKILSKRIRKGDKVIVLAGNDRGQIGEVLTNLGNKLVVQGINVRKKAVRKNEQHPQGGFIDLERPINVSNVKLCIDEKKPVKVKVKTNDEGSRQLYYNDGNNEVLYRSIKKA